MMFDTLIYNGTIVTVDPDFSIIADGLIGIQESRIKRVGAKDNKLPLPESRRMIDAAGGIVMPGLVNTHTHLPMTLFRGLADDLPLATWLNGYIFPAEAAHINPVSVRYGTLLACAEMILSGTTTCCDGYFFETEVAAVVQESGFRAVLGQGVIDFPAPGVQNPTENIDAARMFVEKWLDVSPLIRPSIFCHSPYTCSAETLKKAKDAANEKGVLFQIHVAETKNEVEQIQKEHQTTPIGYLDRLGLLDDNTLLIHSIWVNQEDIALIAERRAKISVTTESEMKLASGIAPVDQFLKSGIAVGLGTDGPASNNDLDLFQEMDFTAKLHKVNLLEPTVMDARTVLTMATMGGANAIGLEKEIGSLEVGKQADIIIIDTRKPHLVPIYNPVSHLVYSVKGSDVRDVIVGGKVVLKDRELLTLDMEEIYEKVNSIRLQTLSE